MARLARIVVPGYPHHVTQRGSRRQPTFFLEQDYQTYLSLMAQWCHRQQVSIWAYCLMPNHVHLVAVPETAEGLSRAIGQAHRQHALIVNAREGWSGHLWQERFASFLMDESYLLAAVRYVELNPVRAGLVRCAEDYPWSSARAHLQGRDDLLVETLPMLERVDHWRDFLGSADPEQDRRLVKHTNAGRPLGSPEFIQELEHILKRSMRPRKSGPKPSTVR